MTAPIVKLRTEAGTVWESVEKRFVQLGDHHWCGTNNEPEPVDDSTIEHVCRIWKVSEDQDWRPPEPPAPESQNPIDQLIQRVQLTGGDLEGNNIPVLAMLYQARSLEMIEFTMREMLQAVERIAGSMETVIQDRGSSTPLQTESGGSGPVELSTWPCSCVHNGFHCSGSVRHFVAGGFVCDKCGDFPHFGDNPQRPDQSPVRSGVEPPDVK